MMSTGREVNKKSAFPTSFDLLTVDLNGDFSAISWVIKNDSILSPSWC